MKGCIERRIFVLFLILECFIKNTPQINFGKYPIYIVCVLGLIVLVKRLLFDREYLFGKKYLIQYLLILSLIISSVINNAVFQYDNLSLLTIYVLMFFIVSNFNYKEDLNCVVDEFVFIARVTTALHLLYSIASIANSIIIKDYEIKGLLGFSYFYAYNCVTVLGLSVFLFLYEKNKILKYGQLINLLLHLVVIFFTRSRTSYLGIFVALLIVIYIIKKCKLNNYDIRKTKNFLILFVMIIAVSIFALSLCFKLEITKVISKVFSANNVLSWRDIIWWVSIMAFLSGNIIFGTSIGILPSSIANYINSMSTDTNVYGKYDKNAYENAFWIASSGHLHNVFIQQLCAYGIFGLIVMLIYIFNALKEYALIIRRKTEQNNVILFLMICFAFTFIAQIIIALFDDNLFFNTVYICNMFFFYSIGVIDYLLNRSLNVKSIK